MDHTPTNAPPLRAEPSARPAARPREGSPGRRRELGRSPALRHGSEAATEPPPGSRGLGSALRRAFRFLRRTANNLTVIKAIAVAAFLGTEVLNRTHFERRAELERLVRRARREGRAVVFASNHLSMLDDPLVPLALFRVGRRALREALGLLALAALWWRTDPSGWWAAALGAVTVATALWVAHRGALKTWWSVADVVNFTTATAVRAKLEGSRGGALTRWHRMVVDLLGVLIRSLMHSDGVKTLLVDRGPGPVAAAARRRVLEESIRLARAGDPVWIFFEGGRSRDPDVVRPALRGVGVLASELRAAGKDPLVIAVHHRGLERVLPIGSRGWVRFGQRVDVTWTEVALAELTDPRDLAEKVRACVVSLQCEWKRAHPHGSDEPARRS